MPVSSRASPLRMLAEMHAAFTVNILTVVTRGFTFVCMITNTPSLLASGSYKILLSLRADACASALSASRHCLRSDWLINKLLNHQRQQPVGRSIAYLETFYSQLFQMVRWEQEIKMKVTAGKWGGVSRSSYMELKRVKILQLTC